MNAFFIAAGLVLLGMHMVIGGWLFYVFPQIGWKTPTFILPVLLTTAVSWVMYYTRHHYGTLENILYFICYTWAGLVFLAFCICAFFALLQWILFFFHIHAPKILGTLSLLLIAAVWGLALWGGLRTPQVKVIDVFIPGAPSFTAAVISDSHLGEGVSVARFKKALAQLEAFRPDTLFVTGDFFEYGPHKQAYAAVMRQFPTPLGKYGVLGNHEYYVGYDSSVQFFKDCGITLLQNTSALMPNGVSVIGVNDIKTTRLTAQQFEKIVEQAPKDAAKVLLSHQPLYLEKAAQNNIRLMLSGHTHNGQLFPFNFLVKTQYPYIYGLYDVNGMKAYVTSGMFYWGIPLRFLTNAEIPLIRVNP